MLNELTNTRGKMGARDADEIDKKRERVKKIKAS